jgi:hypothetical protein
MTHRLSTLTLAAAAGLLGACADRTNAQPPPPAAAAPSLAARAPAQAKQQAGTPLPTRTLQPSSWQPTGPIPFPSSSRSKPATRSSAAARPNKPPPKFKEEFPVIPPDPKPPANEPMWKKRARTW